MADNKISIIVNAKDNASRAISGISGSIQGLGGHAMEGAKQLGTLTMALGGLTTGAVAGLGTKFISDAAAVEQLSISFTTMLGSGEKAKQLIGEISEAAKATPFELPELQNASRSLLAFGVAAEDIVPTLIKLGDLSSGIGAPVGEIAELYGKARVQGRLFMEDINQLTGRGIPIIQELAKQLGVAESEIRGLVEDGEIGFENLEQAVISMTTEGGQFAGLMEAQSKSLTGVISNLQDTFTQLGMEIVGVSKTGEIIEGGLFDVVRKGASDLLVLFEENKQGFINFGKQVINTIFGIADALKFLATGDLTGNFLRLIGQSEDSEFITFLVGARDAFVDFLGVLFPSDEAFQQFAQTAGILTVAIGALAIAVGVLASPLTLIIGIIAGLSLAWVHFGDEIMAVFNTVKDVVVEGLNIVLAWVDARFGDIISTVVEIGGQLISFIQNNWDTISTIIGGALMVIVTAFQVQWGVIWNIVDGFISLITGSINMGLETIQNIFTFFFQVFTGDWQGAFDTVLAQGQTFVSGVVGFFEGMKNTIMGIINTITGAMRDLLGLIGLAGDEGAKAQGQATGLNTAKPNAPQFATGGIVPGNSFSGDNVIARVNSGEMILNKGQQSNLFNMISSFSGLATTALTSIGGSSSDDNLAEESIDMAETGLDLATDSVGILGNLLATATKSFEEAKAANTIQVTATSSLKEINYQMLTVLTDIKTSLLDMVSSSALLPTRTRTSTKKAEMTPEEIEAVRNRAREGLRNLGVENAAPINLNGAITVIANTPRELIENLRNMQQQENTLSMNGFNAGIA